VISVCVNWLFITVTNTWEKQRKGGNIYFGPQCQSFSPWSADCCFWVMVMQTIMTEGCGGAVLLASRLMAARKWRDRKEPGRSYIFPGHSPSDLLPPMRPHLLILPSYCESIKGSMHWLDHSPQDPIPSQRLDLPADPMHGHFEEHFISKPTEFLVKYKGWKFSLLFCRLPLYSVDCFLCCT
jgi:hypothetical protein